MSKYGQRSRVWRFGGLAQNGLEEAVAGCSVSR